MFIGHYSAAFAAKPAHKPIPLWLLFIAVQWLDLWWTGFVLAGVEHVRIVPGFTAASPLDLYDMPYTHGLAGALALSALLGALVAPFFPAQRRRVFLVIFAAAFSHWVLDFVSHPPDLPLVGDQVKVGLGLRRFLWPNLATELGLLVAGALIYARATPARSRIGDIALWAFVAVLATIEIASELGPAPSSIHADLMLAPLFYGLIALGAGFVERLRLVSPSVRKAASGAPA